MLHYADSILLHTYGKCSLLMRTPLLQEKAAKLKADGNGFGYSRAVRRLGATIAGLEEDMDRLEKVYPQVRV